MIRTLKCFKGVQLGQMELSLSVFLVTFSVVLKTSAAVKCYKCEPVSMNNETLCQYFDGDSRYITDCPNSTMCHKRETTLDIGNGVTRVVTRGCAPQTLPGYQEKVNRSWVHVNKIHEVYNETCTEEHDEERLTRSTTCYCRGDLCNGSWRARTDGAVVVLGLLGWLAVYLLQGGPL